MDQLRELRVAHTDPTAFAKDAAKQGLVVSLGEGRRVFHGIKKDWTDVARILITQAEAKSSEAVDNRDGYMMSKWRGYVDGLKELLQAVGPSTIEARERKCYTCKHYVCDVDAFISIENDDTCKIGAWAVAKPKEGCETWEPKN